MRNIPGDQRRRHMHLWNTHSRGCIRSIIWREKLPAPTPGRDSPLPEPELQGSQTRGTPSGIQAVPQEYRRTRFHDARARQPRMTRGQNQELGYAMTRGAWLDGACRRLSKKGEKGEERGEEGGSLCDVCDMFLAITHRYIARGVRVFATDARAPPSTRNANTRIRSTVQ